MTVEELLEAARQNRIRAGEVASSSDDVFAETLTLVADFRAHQRTLSRDVAASWSALLNEERDLLQRRAEVGRRIRELIETGKEELLLSIPPRAMTLPPAEQSEAVHDQLIEGADIDDFSLLEVDMADLRKASQSSPGPVAEVPMPENSSPAKEDAGAGRTTSDSEPAPSWLNLIEDSQPEQAAASPEKYVWPDGLDGVAPARSSLERFATGQPGHNDPWGQLSIGRGSADQLGSLRLPDEAPKTTDSAFQSPSVTLESMPAFVPNHQELDAFSKPPSSSAGMNTVDEAGSSINLADDDGSSDGLDGDEDTDLSIAQDIYLNDGEMVIHESVDVWNAGGAGDAHGDAVPETRNGFLVQPDQTDAEADKRSPISIKVVLRQGVKLFTGFTEDLSTQGAFINCDHVLDRNSFVHLFFELPSGKAVGVNAEVRWERPAEAPSTPRGVGVHFLDLSPDGRTHIQAAMDAHETSG